MVSFIVIYRKIFKSKRNSTLFINKNKKSFNKTQDLEDVSTENNKFITLQTMTGSMTKLSKTVKLSQSNVSCETLNKQEYRNNDVYNDDDHKYHEITDLSVSSSENTVSNLINNELSLVTQSFLLTDNSYANQDCDTVGNIRVFKEQLPPPYSKIHMFKNANTKQTPIQGKSTYV